MARRLRRTALLLMVSTALGACTGDRDGGRDGGGDVDGSETDGAIALRSPDGDLQISVWLEVDGSLRYRVFRGDGGPEDTAVHSSRLEISFDEADFVDGLSMVGAGEPRSRTITLDLPRGKQRPVEAEAVERTIEVSNADGDRLALDLVAFDDGVAHRFRTLGDRPMTLVADRSSFRFDDGGEMFVQAYDRTGTYTPASEALYSGPRRITEIYPAFNGWSFPALFHTGDHWTLVTETGVGRTDVGSRLVNDLDSSEFVLTPPSADQGEGPTVTSSPDDKPGLPWKVIVTTTDIGDLVTTSIPELLAEPSQIDDPSWVASGRVSWSWWSDSDSPTKPDVLRRFIDYAAEMGWEYSLIDANWNTMEAGALEELVGYARNRGVGVFLWYNSGGPHNTVAEQPRDRFTDRDVRRAEMAMLNELGVVGVKVDFFHGDKESINALALDIAADAADHELMVNFHGITSPKGWHVTWPNLLTTEAVRGAEQYKFDERFPDLAAAHNTVLAFTRNVVGPMDYTPVTLSDVDFRRVTTAAHELALGIVFESGLQHLADKPAAYDRLGEPGLDYLRRLPVSWDETVLLAGEPGSHVVFARRSGDAWWIGGINGADEPKTIELDLGRLDGIGNLRLATDGQGRDDVVFSAVDGETLDVELAPAGGFVAWPTP